MDGQPVFGAALTPTRRAMSEILVAGGGIGGLTAALCMARQGIQVRLFEQAPAFEETGAGLQLSPNASRVMHDLALEAPLRSIALLPEAIEIRHWRDGRILARYPLGEHVRNTYGFPYYLVMRSDLVTCLADAALGDPRIELHAGARVERIHQSRASVAVSVNGNRQIGSMLVGADGISSTVRTALFGSETPAYSGDIAWRAIVSAAGLPEAIMQPVVKIWWGPGKHFVHYPVRDSALVNCVGVVARRHEPQPGSWIEPGDCEEFRSDFAGWHRDVQALIDGTERDGCYKWALFDRPPMPHWSDHRITLLGDACHAALPFMAQGAAMAIEDAAVLARCVADGGDVPRALARYESLRRDRTAQVQRHSRRNAKIFHLSGLSAWLRNQSISLVGDRFFRRLFAYNAVESSES